MILDEPEARLHPDLLAPLARLILKASARCQIIVVSHAAQLVDALERHQVARGLRLYKELGETLVEDVERPRWVWPAR